MIRLTSSQCLGWLFVLILCLPSGLSAAAGGAAGESPSSVEERRLQQSIQDELARLGEREELLRLRELELKTLEQEVDKKLAEMKKSREELSELLRQKGVEEQNRTRELSRMYGKMEAAKAASLLTTLDEPLAIEILSGLKAKTAGRILNNMEQETAARLSKGYSTVEND